MQTFFDDQTVSLPLTPGDKGRWRGRSIWLPSRVDRWTPWHAVAATLMALMGIAATWEAWRDMFDWARLDEEYSHIFLVPVVAMCMVWVRRHRFRYCKPTGTGLGVLVAVVAITTVPSHFGMEEPSLSCSVVLPLSWVATCFSDFFRP
jgi:hypothetical protein